MKRRSNFFVIPVVLLPVVLVLFLAKILLFDHADAGKPSEAEIIKNTQKLQIPFIVNNGQFDERVKFYTNIFGGNAFVTKEGEIVYSLFPFSGKNNLPRPFVEERTCAWGKALALKEELVGGKIDKIEGEGSSVTTVNYLKGNDPAQWKNNIPTYEIVNFGEVYKGIDLKLKAYGNNVEKLFYVRSYADPEMIKIRLIGAKNVRVNENGQLEAETDLGAVKFTKPMAYQDINGKRVEVAAEYSLASPKSEIQNSQSACVYSLRVAAYDRTRELVIDPLIASTYLGGAKEDYGYSIAIDPSKNIYVAGCTGSPNFPATTGVFDVSYNGGVFDAFVSKFNKDLTRLLAFTYLGGSNDDRIRSIAIDSNKNVCVAGYTESADFPVIHGAFDTSSSYGDAFVSKLSGDLTHLLASTYLGGSSNDRACSLAIDSGGNICVTGETWSTDFPITMGAYDASYNGGDRDIFVSKLSGDLTRLLASTYLGGTSADYADFMAIKSSGEIYVTGYTWSTDFPTTRGAYGTSCSIEDGFVSKLNGDLTCLLASTYLGGTGGDCASSMAINSDGNVYVVGYSRSADFPTTRGAYDTSYNIVDGFVSKLNGDLTRLLASTYLGGSNYDYVNSITIDSGGNVYVAGETGSTDFPTTPGVYQTTNKEGSTSAFVSKMSGDLARLLASTYLGGASYDSCRSLAIDADGDIYVTGYTGSSNFPTTPGSYDVSFEGYYDAFVSEFDSNLSASPLPPTVTTGFASNVTAHSAILNGTANANGLSTKTWFEYGIINEFYSRGLYGNISPAQNINGSVSTMASIPIDELSPETTYYYRFVAQSSAGIVHGIENKFTTLNEKR